MSEPTTQHRLSGLEPDNLLAFLALLGLLRTLEEGRPEWRSRAFWDIDTTPLRPILVLRQPQTRQAVAEAAAAGCDTLAPAYEFGNEKNLNFKADAAREIQAAALKDAVRARLHASLFSDVAAKDDGTIVATPLCQLFGQGHQHFLERLAAVPATPAPPLRGRGRKAIAIDAVQCLAEALFVPWIRVDPTPAFRWDPAESMRYALRGQNPSGEKTLTQHGANRLAVFGLMSITAVPRTRRGRVGLATRGGNWDPDGFSTVWPIWDVPATLAAIEAMLAHPDLAKPGGLSHLGVQEVRKARRISVGKFMNFARAEPLSVDLL